MATPTLVFEVISDVPALGAQTGDFVVCEPGSVPPETDVLLVRALPRGRLGHLLGAANDGAMRLCDPVASAASAVELLEQLLPPASPG